MNMKEEISSSESRIRPSNKKCFEIILSATTPAMIVDEKGGFCC